MSGYIVEIKYAPEKNADDQIERIKFDTQSAALAFANRKNQMKNVEIARYVGIEK